MAGGGGWVCMVVWNSRKVSTSMLMIARRLASLIVLGGVFNIPKAETFRSSFHRFGARGLHLKSLRMTPPTLRDGDALFGKFAIPSSSIFYRTESSLAFVNLRPIVPGHVLVIPSRSIGDNALLSDLSDDEYVDMWLTVRKVQTMLKKHYGCNGFNVAVQDGRSAGQSVPHVHVHILPRSDADTYAGDDAVYEVLEAWAPKGDGTPPARMEIPQEREDRTPEKMAEEAAVYRRVFEAI